MEKSRMKETLLQAGLEEEKLKQIEEDAKKGAKQAVNVSSSKL